MPPSNIPPLFVPWGGGGGEGGREGGGGGEGGGREGGGGGKEGGRGRWGGEGGREGGRERGKGGWEGVGKGVGKGGREGKGEGESPADYSDHSWCLGLQFMEQLVFLQPNLGQYVPHILYCLEVYPGIMLVLIAEHGNLQNLAALICQILLLLDATGIFLSTTKLASAQGSYDTLDDCIK